MKKFTFLLISLLFVFSTKGQEKFETYHSKYLKKDFRIDISKSKKDEISFWINANSMDKSSKNISLKVEKNNLDNFITLIKKSKEKFTEWSKVAKENNVEKLNKTIEFKSNKYTVAFTYGEWHFDFNVKLQSRFMVLKDKNVIIIENKNKVVASDNKYIDSSGFVIVFESEKEIDSFVSKINLEKAKEKLNSKKKKQDLFKQ